MSWSVKENSYVSLYICTVYIYMTYLINHNKITNMNHYYYHVYVYICNIVHLLLMFIC